MSVTPSSEEALETAVLAYLAKYPNAADTLGGIAEWWLERQAIHVEVTALARALERLVERRMLQQVNVGNNEALYRLPETKIGLVTK